MEDNVDNNQNEVETTDEFTMDDFINSIDNNTLSDAEDMFNSIMDTKVADKLDAMRQQYAQSIFDDSPVETEDAVEDNLEPEQEVEVQDDQGDDNV